MNTSNDYNRIKNSYGIKDVFSIGLNSVFENVDRTYLDETNSEGLDLFLYLNQLLYDKLEKLLGKEFYVCITTYTDNLEYTLPKENVESLKYFDLNISENSVFDTCYIEEDELFLNIIFHEESITNLKSYIWGVLACNFKNIEPYLNVDIFFIDKKLEHIINIYDDRGVDIMKLEF